MFLIKRCSIIALAASRLPISIEQYLEAELTAPVKHEYVAGHIYAMVGTSKAHNLVALALVFSPTLAFAWRTLSGIYG